MSTSHRKRIEYAQNFFRSTRLVQHLVNHSSLGHDDLVIEIGPGDGAITSALVDSCRHVIAVEKDPRQVSRLARRFPVQRNLTVFAADFLEFPLPHTPYKVFASIPYNATAAIVGKLTTGNAPPDDVYLVIQREAALRFLERTLVAAQIAPWFRLSLEHAFRRTDFHPVPAVDSVLLRIARRNEPLVADSVRERYLDFVTAIFTAWKPTAHEAARSLFLPHAARVLDETLGAQVVRRPSDVVTEQWVTAFLAVDGLGDDKVWRSISGAHEHLARQQAGLDKRSRTTVATPRGHDRRRPGNR